MKELVTIEQADMVLRFIALAAPLLGLTIGAMAGWTHKQALRGTALGLAIGMAGPAVFGMWRMYLAFGDRYGFTSVGSLVAQAVIFLVLGLAASAMIREAVRRTSSGGRQQ